MTKSKPVSESTYNQVAAKLTCDTKKHAKETLRKFGVSQNADNVAKVQELRRLFLYVHTYMTVPCGGVRMSAAKREASRRFQAKARASKRQLSILISHETRAQLDALKARYGLKNIPATVTRLVETAAQAPITNTTEDL